MLKSTSITIKAFLLFVGVIVLVHSSPVDPEGIRAANHLVKRQCNRGYYFVDDQDAKFPLGYEGSWVHLKNQGSSVQRGTLSYTGQANAMLTLLPAVAPGTTALANVTVWSTKKNDRGRFNVYSGQTLLGTGDQYTSAPQETATQKVFYRQNVIISGNQPFVIKNDKGAPFMAFDAIEVEFCR
ncbi:hypothetical protein P389DRAFT_197320 [Cystobasidium minutum MCA 4210]|uniref:uncharacterized protein n=1 Tax=Cystobasidium minutum MCA 4210 TaxID=1397322 RepID=UPI0034CF6F2A|eukprot:jgi/Rhomi1/197320/gm1.5534_g